MDAKTWMVAGLAGGVLLWTGGARADTAGGEATRASGDGVFLARAMGVNELELRLGKVAAERASAPETRAAAQKMVSNHTALGERLAAMARDAGLPQDPQLTPEQEATLARVSAEPADTFDAAFKRTVDDGHVKELAMYEAEVDRAASPKLQEFAAERVSALRKAVAAAAGAPKAQARTGR